MRGNRIVGWVLFSVFFIPQVHASGFGVEISPIIGYDQVQLVLPTPHTSSRLVYGGLVTVGILLISGEAQYTHGVSQETFPSLSQTATGDRLKVGLRSGVHLGPLLSVHVRGGVQATQDKYDQTSNGVTTTTFQPLTYSPYAGLGATASLTSKLSASADIVAVIPNINNMSQNEYQVTAGFAIHLP